MPWPKGKHHSDETRAKISSSMHAALASSEVSPPVARHDLPDDALFVCHLEDDELLAVCAPPKPLTDAEFYERLGKAEYLEFGHVIHEPPMPKPEPVPEPESPHGPVTIVEPGVPVEEEIEEIPGEPVPDVPLPP